MRKYRRRAFRGQTGEKAGCTCPCAANYDPTATTNDDSCMYTGGPSPVGATDGIKPTINRPTNVFRGQTGMRSASGRGFKNQIGNPTAFQWQQIQEDFATYGGRKCSDNGPSTCKCDCLLDGVEDFNLPLPYEAMGNWIPNYPLPTSLQHAMIIDFLCCYNACNEACFGPTEGLSGSDGITPVGGGTSSSGGGKGDLTSPAKLKRRDMRSASGTSNDFGGLSFQCQDEPFASVTGKGKKGYDEPDISSEPPWWALTALGWVAGLKKQKSCICPQQDGSSITLTDCNRLQPCEKCCTNSTGGYAGGGYDPNQSSLTEG